MHSTFLGRRGMKTRRNSTYVPLSTISPSWRTRIWLAWMMVESLWATIIVVRFSHTFAREAWMFLSVCVSSAEVAYIDVIKEFKRTGIFIQSVQKNRKPFILCWPVKKSIRSKLRNWKDETNLIKQHKFRWFEDCSGNSYSLFLATTQLKSSLSNFCAISCI